DLLRWMIANLPGPPRRLKCRLPVASIAFRHGRQASRLSPAGDAWPKMAAAHRISGPAMDIRDWLEQLGLGRYADAFATNDIDEATLRGLTAEELRELGVPSLGHRKRILDAIS